MEPTTYAQQIINDAFYSELAATEEGDFCPHLLSLYDRLASASGNIPDRIAVLQDIAKNYNKYLGHLDLKPGIKEGTVLECDSLIHFQEIIMKFLEKPINKKDFEYYVAKSCPQLAELTLYLQHLPQLGAPYYFAYIQGYAFYINKDRKNPIKAACLSALQVKNCLGKVFTKDIIDFCKYLMIGETFRRHFLCVLDPNEFVTLQNFEIVQRNKYFEEYIRSRVHSIKIEMDEDKYRLYPPEQIDYLNRLLEEEEQAYRQEKALDEFPNSSAYAELNYAARQDVIAMADLFIRYLKDYITRHSKDNQREGVSYHIKAKQVTLNEIHDNNNITVNSK